MRVMTVVGARPEFIQMTCVSQSIRQRGHTELLVHTGQHYDANMSNVFFSDLGLPDPDYNLGVGSGSSPEQTGQIMLRLEEVMNHHRPDWVVVYGDTNSTLAASVAAAQLHLPTAHIEAGLRSFDRSMPEEINRIVADHLGSLLLAPTRTAVHNLKREGLVEAVRQVGDVRVDVLWQVEQHAEQQIKRLCEQARQRYGSFALATIHRQANTDYYERLHAIISALKQAGLTVVLPVHPRLRKQMAEFDLEFGSNVVPIDPVGIVEMIALLKACEIVITDSGGLQKEAYLFRRPAVTLRDSTEWVETVETGWNRLSEPEPSAFLAAVEAARRDPPAEHPNLYGTYGVSERIIALLEQNTAA